MTSNLMQLTRKGKSAWKVVLSAKASKVERFAACELQKYVALMSGAKLAIAGKKAQATGSQILIGLRKDLGRVAGLPLAKEGFDGYSILVSPKLIAIASDNPRGVLYGVYDLLERLGCRWYHPTMDPNDPEVVPRNLDLSLPCGKWSEAAAIEYRWYNGSAFFVDMRGERLLPQIDWAAKNRFSGVSWQASTKPGGVEQGMRDMQACGALDALEERGIMLGGPGHAFTFFLSEEEYFEKHPEWFGMLNGQRRTYGPTWPFVNHCWSNAEANKQLIDNMITFCKRWPQMQVLTPVWIDGGMVCQCPECQQIGGANLIIDLFNLMADRLEKEAPWVTLESVLGYPPIEDVPTGSQPNGKWMGLYAHWGRNHQHSYEDAAYGKKANLLTWASYFPGMFEICSYYAASSHETFFAPPFLHALEGDARFCVDQKVKGHFVLQYPHGFWWNFSFNMKMGGLFGYYYPNRTPKEELQDYALSYFGPQAGPLLHELFVLMGSNGDSNLEVSYRATRGEATDGDVAILREWDKVIERAAYLAKDDKVASYRIAKLRGAHAMVMHWAQGQRLRRDAEEKFEQYKKGGASREDVAKCIDEAREYIDGLLAHAAEVEAQYPGVMEATWLKSWWTERTIAGVLNGIEKNLEGKEADAKSAKPGHVAGMEE